MRLATVVTPDGAYRAAVDDHGVWRALAAPDLSALLADPRWVDVAREPGPPLPGATLTNPVPNPAKVICCGLNYAEHIREMGRDLPEHPTLFAKFADTLTGPNDDITFPAGVDVDWEAELAVVVGTQLRDADEATARKAVAGYTVANDISVRDFQRRTLQWLQGKAWDRSTPIGPVLVTPDEVDPEAGLDLSCEIDGETVQLASTKSLVFSPANMLAYISQFTTLRPGDVVLTGTPGGVGMGMRPQRFLRDGDVVLTKIDGIGLLKNTFRTIQDTEENS
jgi:acylpyruvate hydrolase